MMTNLVVGTCAVISLTALLCAVFCELGYKRGLEVGKLSGNLEGFAAGKEAGEKEGFKDGYQMGKVHEENWWLGIDAGIDQGRQELWREQAEKRERRR